MKQTIMNIVYKLFLCLTLLDLVSMTEINFNFGGKLPLIVDNPLNIVEAINCWLSLGKWHFESVPLFLFVSFFFSVFLYSPSHYNEFSCSDICLVICK